MQNITLQIRKHMSYLVLAGAYQLYRFDRDLIHKGIC